jgi:hypothetical protein
MRLGALVFAFLFLVGCGGGNVNTVPVQQPNANTVSMTFDITIVESLTNVARVTISGAPASGGSAFEMQTACGGAHCMISGSGIAYDDVLFQIALLDPNGTVLDQDAIELDTGSVRGTVFVVFGGNPSSALLSVTPAQLSYGTAATATLHVVALDAQGRRILGSAPFTTPIPITSSDQAGATTLAGSTIAAPAQRIAISYNGAADPPVEFSGGPGVSGATLALVSGPEGPVAPHGLSDAVIDSAEELASVPLAPSNPPAALGYRRRTASLSATDLSADPAAFPPVANQYPSSMCAVFSGVYAIRSYQERLMKGWSLDGSGPFGINSATVFSPTFTYNQPGVNHGEDDGASLMSVARSLTRYGAVPWSVVPWTPSDPSTDYRFTSAGAFAEQYRLQTYERIDSGDAATVKQYLAAGYPIYWGTLVDSQFVETDFAGPWVSGARGALLFGHAMVIVGYNDTISLNAHTGGFKVLNSWGTSWGQSGYVWIAYDWWQQLPINELFVLLP